MKNLESYGHTEEGHWNAWLCEHCGETHHVQVLLDDICNPTGFCPLLAAAKKFRNHRLEAWRIWDRYKSSFTWSEVRAKARELHEEAGHADWYGALPLEPSLIIASGEVLDEGSRFGGHSSPEAYLEDWRDPWNLQLAELSDLHTESQQCNIVDQFEAICSDLGLAGAWHGCDYDELEGITELLGDSGTVEVYELEVDEFDDPDCEETSAIVHWNLPFKVAQELSNRLTDAIEATQQLVMKASCSSSNSTTTN